LNVDSNVHKKRFKTTKTQSKKHVFTFLNTCVYVNYETVPTDSCRHGCCGKVLDVAAVTVAAAAADVDDKDDGVVALSPSSLAPRPLSVTDPPEPTLPSSPASSSAVASATALTVGHFTRTRIVNLDMTV